MWQLVLEQEFRYLTAHYEYVTTFKILAEVAATE